ncbi:hypothetical protein N9176_00330 [bacterium]|nr:hypothetical protein [bacterium]
MSNQLKINFILLLLFGQTFLSSCQGQKGSDDPQPVGKFVSKIDQAAGNIFQDSKSNYWFGTLEQGVFKYDGKSIIQFTATDGLSGNRIRGIQEDRKGNIYFDTGQGINKYDGKSIITLEKSDAPKGNWKLELDDLWFAGNWNENGPYRYDGEYLHHLEIPKHELEDEFYRINKLATYSPYEVYKIYKDRKGNIWIGTSVFGACRFDGNEINWISEREMTEIDEGPAPGVRSIFEDGDGNFWFSSNVNHKYKVLEEKSLPLDSKLRYEKVEAIDNSSEPEMSSYFMSILEDNVGDIWMATYDSGVWRHDGQELYHYDVIIDKKDVSIFTIYKDNSGELWLGTHDAGPLKFNGKTFEKYLPEITLDN